MSERRDLLPHRPFAQRRGRKDRCSATPSSASCSWSATAYSDLQEAGPRVRRQGHPVLVLESTSGATSSSVRPAMCGITRVVSGLDRADRGRSYRLNEARLDPLRSLVSNARHRPSTAAQGELEGGGRPICSQDAGAGTGGLVGQRRARAKPLRSLLKHREGLCVFVDKPQVPMDEQCRRARAPRAGHRAPADVRLQQRGPARSSPRSCTRSLGTLSR